MYVLNMQTIKIIDTSKLARISIGNCNSAEQCLNDSSYPDGQWLIPSHHTLEFTQASSSGHMNIQSSAEKKIMK